MSLKSILSIFTVIAYIKRNLVVSSAVACGKTCKILERIKCFASVTDNHAETLAVKLYKGGIIFFVNFNFSILTAEALKYGF